jgi:hypothetical protein
VVSVEAQVDQEEQQPVHHVEEDGMEKGLPQPQMRAAFAGRAGWEGDRRKQNGYEDDLLHGTGTGQAKYFVTALVPMC